MFTTMDYGVYIFFATMLVLASIYAAFFIRETKGRRIDEMDQLFGFVREGTNYAKELEAAETKATSVGVEVA